LKRWIVTMGGVGYLPASGTFASLLTCLILWGILLLPNSPSLNLLGIVGTVFFSALTVGLGKWATDFFGRKDPGQLVLDEAAGICLTALFLPEVWPLPYRLLAIFAAFRVFDISKPFPLKQLERLPYGWGILLDDLGAAIYANLVCQIIMRSLR
jgi:phosphatidylglycerophosphatase A